MSSRVALNGGHVVRAVSPETGMVFALGITVVFLTLADGWNLQLSMGPGLSAKNAILYVLAMALATKIVMQRRFELELGALHACFIALIVYAALSVFATAFIVAYPRYELFNAIIDMKVKIVDHAIFFLVFFYGLRESRNVHRILALLLAGAVFANALAVLDAIGVIRLSGLEIREDGRVGGVIGEANQYGAYVALFVPGLIAAAIIARGFSRLLWIAGALISAIALIMTVSRGAYVAVLVAIVWAGLLMPRHLPLGRIAAVGGIAIGVALLLLLVFSASYWDLVMDRLFQQSVRGDMVDISSGRTEIWADALARMMEAPITFITGYGLTVYNLMPFRFAPHNHYLWLWFELGLVGLACGVLLFALVIRQVRAAVDYAPPHERPLLVAYVVGTLSFAVAAFFVNLFQPWPWFWAYTGLLMRLAVNAQRGLFRTADTISATSQDAPRPRDLYGWTTSPRQAR